MTVSTLPAAVPVPQPNWGIRVPTMVYVIALGVVCIWQHQVLFAWPGGIVTGNLLASAIWAPLAVVHLDRLAVKHHREHLALLHHQHMEHLAVIAGHRRVVTSADGKTTTVPVPRLSAP